MNELQQLQARHHAHQLVQTEPTPAQETNPSESTSAKNNSPLDNALRQVLQYQTQLKQANQDVDEILKRTARGKKLNASLLTDAHARQRLAIHQLTQIFSGLFAQHPELALYIQQQLPTANPTIPQEASVTAPANHADGNRSN